MKNKNVNIEKRKYDKGQIFVKIMAEGTKKAIEIANRSVENK